MIVEAIDSVTRRPDESYETFILRAAANRIGRRVKLADLRDNSDVTRIPNPTQRDYERIAKYRKAITLIEQLEQDPAGR